MTSRIGRLVPPSRRSRSGIALTRMESRGTKVSGAHFCALRYLIASLATPSSSTTIASIALPIAIVTAVLYFRCVVLQRSNVRPKVPGMRRFRLSSASADLRSRSLSRCSALEADSLDVSCTSVSRSSACRSRDVEPLVFAACSSFSHSAASALSVATRSARPFLRSLKPPCRPSSTPRLAASSSSLVRPCISSGSSERSSRVIAESCSCRAADFAPASPLRREYSSRCRLFISTSPLDSASCCSAVARASASEMSASCFSSPFCCLVAALCASSTLSSDLACVARRRSTCLISSRSLIAPGFCLSTFCSREACCRSRSTARLASRARSFSLARRVASAVACLSLSASRAAASDPSCSRSVTISRSMPYSFCRYCSCCSSRFRSSSAWYASASSFCRFMMCRSCVSPLFLCWLKICSSSARFFSAARASYSSASSSEPEICSNSLESSLADFCASSDT
mmetsp:Transcript_19380/g.61770  ORF Transcript_19380/g.61770 Transcript_19380/m.61770 type:complete len:458 (-) Transcript_19380:300-1673(-)